jgi:hypothetical protein
MLETTNQQLQTSNNNLTQDIKLKDLTQTTMSKSLENKEAKIIELSQEKQTF